MSPSFVILILSASLGKRSQPEKFHVDDVWSVEFLIGRYSINCGAQIRTNPITSRIPRVPGYQDFF